MFFGGSVCGGLKCVFEKGCVFLIECVFGENLCKRGECEWRSGECVVVWSAYFRGRMCSAQLCFGREYVLKKSV